MATLNLNDKVKTKFDKAWEEYNENSPIEKSRGQFLWDMLKYFERNNIKYENL